MLEPFKIVASKGVAGVADGKQVQVGIVGCGDVLGRYVPGLRRYPELRIVHCADLNPELAESAARRYGIDRAGTPSQLYADDEVDVIVNLTPPVAHSQVTMAALAAGKHVYVEKPIATSLADARSAIATAAERGLLLGAATDTFLGSAAQTARAALDEGRIGEPIGVTVFVPHGKVETRHPNPAAFFQPGGGPVLDLGPYYLGNLLAMLGPVDTVYGAARRGAARRPVTSPEREVDYVDVNVDTHATAVLRLTSGVLATVMMSFDVWDHHLPHTEIYGTEGALAMPFPLHYDGDVTIKRHDDAEWRVLDPVIDRVAAPGPDQFLRGRGVADLAAALHGEPLRVSGELAAHVFEVLDAIDVSSRNNAPVEIASSCTRPEPVAVPTLRR